MRGLLAYLAFALIAVAGPGLALQRLLRLPVDAALVLPLGLLIAAGAWGLSLASGWTALGPLLVALLLVAGLSRREPWTKAAGPGWRSLAAPLLALVAFLALAAYPWNRTGADGDFLADPLESIDTTFHVGLVFELQQGWPAQVPGFSGQALHYHLGHPLLRAAAARFTGLHPYDLLSRYDVTLVGVALVLALLGLAHRLGLRGAALLVAGLSPLLCDFSWLLGTRPGAEWWADLTSSNLVLWLAFGNSLIPALALWLAALLAFTRYAEGEGRGWLVPAVACALAVPGFKAFLAAQAAAGLAFALWRTRDPRLLWLLAPLSAGCLPLLASHGTSSVSVGFEPLAPLLRTAQSLDFPSTGLGLLAFAGAWAVVALGARLAGLAALGRATRRPAHLAEAVLAGAVLAGWLVGLALRITFAGEGTAYNEAFYFLMQSGALLWLFAARSLEGLRGLRLAGAGLLLALLALPSTTQFVARRRGLEPLRIPSQVVRAMQRLQAESRPGDVVLQPAFSRFPPAPLVLAGRRLAFTRYIPYMAQFAPPERVQQRRAAVERFFETREIREAACLAAGLGARQVFLFGPVSLGFEPEPLLEERFVERNARLFRIRPEALSACPGP